MCEVGQSLKLPGPADLVWQILAQTEQRRNETALELLKLTRHRQLRDGFRSGSASCVASTGRAVGSAEKETETPAAAGYAGCFIERFPSLGMY